MVRKYRLEWRQVRVPIIWQAKVPEKKLTPVTRRVSEKRSIERNARKESHMFFKSLFEGVPEIFRPPEFQPLTKPEGKPVEWRRWRSFSEVGKGNG